MQKLPEDLLKLQERIEKVQKQVKKSEFSNLNESEFARSSRIGFRIGAELLSGVLAGAAIGYFLDSWLETKPVLLVAFLFFGGAAGILNVYRFAKSEEKKQGD